MQIVSSEIDLQKYSNKSQIGTNNFFRKNLKDLLCFFHRIVRTKGSIKRNKRETKE
jgi:hypothetical protein